MASVTDLEARQAEIGTRLKELDAEAAGEQLTVEARDEWNALNVELEENVEHVKELKSRMQRLAELSGDPSSTEGETGLKGFQTRRSGSRVPDDPTQLEEYRKRATSIDELAQAHADGARKILERFRHAHPAVSREEAQNDIDGLIDRDQEVAVRMIATSSPRYKREFAAYVGNGQVGPEMQRTALSLAVGQGGYAVPVELDTSLILANAGVVNPVRNLARVRQTNVNHVEFINTAGVTAAFNAEATEASDNSPVLAQPAVDIEKAFAFVPMSIEIAQDWANIQSDLAMTFADAKDQLEAQKFLTGLGHGSHEPQGLIAVGGATAAVTTAGTAIFALADIYTLSAALSPRYRGNATLVANRAIFDKARQFNTAGTYGAWVDLADGRPSRLTGYPVAEWSNYSAVTTTGSTIATLGDFNYFAIVDRVGMNVELIPHLFGGSSRYPTGQRGLYMWWRTSSQVLSPVTPQSVSAFVSLKTL
jgi:HK97 family phage major capsid protein